MKPTVPNVTLKVDPAIKDRAAARAREEGSSLTGVITAFLDRYGSGPAGSRTTVPAPPPPPKEPNA